MKATLPNGTVLEGTPEELRAIFGPDITGANGKPLASGNSPGNGNPTLWDEAKMKEFWDSLDREHDGGNQKKLLRFLVARNGRATWDESLKALNFSGPRGGARWAGVCANITRNARRVTQNDQAKVIEWKRTDNNGNGFFFIPEGIFPLLQKVAD